MKTLLPLLPSILLGLAFVLDANAADIVWTNTSGGNWSVPANWNPNQTPGGGAAADTVVATWRMTAVLTGQHLGRFRAEFRKENQ